MCLKSELVPAQLFCFWVWSAQQKSRFSEHHALWHVWSWGSETCLLHVLWLGEWSWGAPSTPCLAMGFSSKCFLILSSWECVIK